jgi:hypothetical protein
VIGSDLEGHERDGCNNPRREDYHKRIVEAVRDKHCARHVGQEEAVNPYGEALPIYSR